jgi:hypothetical protein
MTTRSDTRRVTRYLGVADRSGRSDRTSKGLGVEASGTLMILSPPARAR